MLGTPITEEQFDDYMIRGYTHFYLTIPVNVGAESVGMEDSVRAWVK